MNVPFHNIGGVILIFWYFFFRFYYYLSKTSSVLAGLEVFLFMWGVLGPCIYIVSNFSLLHGLF